MKTYRVSLIGCGRVGLLLEEDPLRVKPASHLGGIQKLHTSNSPDIHIELTSLCDINPERLHYAAKKWQVHHTYHDYKQQIAQEKPDIIIIASWTSSHHKIVVYAAEHGVKGIVLEKPVATTLHYAEEMIAICQQKNVKLVVNHERRWDPLYRKIREIIENNTLGPLRTIYGNVLSRSGVQGDWRTILPAVGGGPLLHDGTHLIDMVRYLAGDIAHLCGHVKREDPNMAVETSATAMLHTHHNVTVFIEAGGMRDYFNFELDLHFQYGRIRAGNGIRDYYVVEDSKRYSGFKDLVKQPFPALTTLSDPFTGALLEVIHAIETDTIPESSGVDAYKAMEIIFAIYHSASCNGKTITLPLRPTRIHPLKKMFRAGKL